MKKILFASLLIMGTTVFAQAQDRETDSYLGVKLGQVKMNNFSQRNFVGVQLDIAVSKKVGIEYEFLFGRRYLKLPIAPFGGFVLGREIAREPGDSTIEMNKILPGIIIGLIVAAIPDGISYRINMNERIGIAPYIKPLQYVDINDKGGNYASSAAGSLGVRFNIYTFDKKFRFAPFIEGQVLYKKGNYTGISYGLSASYRIARKKLKVSTE